MDEVMKVATGFADSNGTPLNFGDPIRVYGIHESTVQPGKSFWQGMPIVALPDETVLLETLIKWGHVVKLT